MPVEDIAADFPNLKSGEWIKTSEIDDSYNCIAFASHDAERYWDPNAMGRGYYWPPGIPRDWRKTTLIKLFQLQGFQVCTHSAVEDGYEKIVIYADFDGEATHAARQKASGLWTSKLGPSEDIEHEKPEGLNGDVYGETAVFMRRRRLRGVIYE